MLKKKAINYSQIIMVVLCMMMYALFVRYGTVPKILIICVSEVNIPLATVGCQRIQ